MLKKGLASLVGLIVMSALWSWAATTWQLQTKLSNPGGSIKVRNNPTQTAVGTAYTNFTTAAAVPVSVAAGTGYKIANLTKNGSALSIGNYTSHYSTTFQKSGGTSQSLVAGFAARQYIVNATSTGDGTVTPASALVNHGGSAVFTASRNNLNSFLTEVSDGTVTDLSGQPVRNPCAGPVKITVANVVSPRTVALRFTTYGATAGANRYAQIDTRVTLEGSLVGNGTPSWSQVGGPAASLAGATTLTPSFTPSAAGGYLFQLSQYVGAVSVASATIQVTVVASLSDNMRQNCMGCHGAGGLFPTPAVFQRWSVSSHRSVGVSCVTCHTNGAMPTPVNLASVAAATFKVSAASAGTVGSYYCVSCHNQDIATGFDASRHSSAGVVCSSCHSQGAHNPAASSSACSSCHIDQTGQVAGHPFPIGAGAACTSCHNPHNLRSTLGSLPGALGVLHFNNVTSGRYPASYVTSRASCSDCHFDSPANPVIRQQWYSSGHAYTVGGAWIDYDFKTRSGCVQCHTTTGFIAYSTGKVTAAWGVASDKTKEVLTCIGCHRDMTTGAIRTVKPVRPYPDDAYTNREVGRSNICLDCHSGRKNGASITARLAELADFGNLAFIVPHYLAAGGVLHGKGGYHFPGTAPYAFYSSNSHRRIGMGDLNGTGSSGPCIACHKTGASGHGFLAGATPLCANCHGSAMSDGELSLKKADFANALGVLKAMLADKGHPYAESYPNFANTNWGADQAGADTMGAAFNYALLLNEPGAYAHNADYAKRLIVESVDYLQNGTVTGSIESALTHLVEQNKISQQSADSMAAYRAGGSCVNCHTNRSGSHTAHLNGGFGCADCHRATVASDTTLDPGSSAHLNGVVDLLAGPGRSFSYLAAPAGGTCSAISCHNNGSAVWGGTLGCDGCHDSPPATASHLKHYGGSVAQAAYGSTSIAQNFSSNATAYIMNCGNCHPMDGARHGNGVVDVELYNPLAPAGSLKALNPTTASYLPGETVQRDARGIPYTLGSCGNVYCHSYNDWATTTAVPEFDPNWQAKVVVTRRYKAVTWGGAPLGCSGCHGNPTQTNFLNNDGGAGDSHSWIDCYGYQSLHTYNMGESPVSCRTCHNDTVKQANSYTEDGLGVRTMGPVPISNFSKHVNGRNDVAFDRQNSFSYYGNAPLNLVPAAYDPATRNCSNVSCHVSQTTVKWGTPYRWDSNECDICHGYRY